MQPDPGLAETIFNLAIDMVKLDPGALARLRRMDPEGPGTAEFWRLALKHDLRADAAGQRLVALMAQLTPRGEPGGKRLHDRDVPFGQALAAAGYPETRLLRCLATPFDMRTDGIEAMVRWLAAKGHQGIDCRDLARLLWFGDAETERRLARSYFTEQKKQPALKDIAA